MPDAGNNTEGEYFAGLFGTPELTRRPNWGGREEPLSLMLGDHHLSGDILREMWEKDTSDPNSAAYGMPVPGNTIDIDHEVVD